MPTVIGTSKITSKGQVTIPAELRSYPGFAPGGRVTFVEDGGNLVLLGNDLGALGQLGEAFRGAAEEAGIRSEDDVVALVNDLRAGREI
ncbi:MAG: AbrB/MazE/SpoVT family DNA-binding domain-containing protein [Eggerthellaceae bacterium]|nr:AbrB/MazE/SpoVT family DNA-binding domain-containing protein [Eggerthellaceae bacterium]